jgi:hypothetical protein
MMMEKYCHYYHYGKFSILFLQYICCNLILFHYVVNLFLHKPQLNVYAHSSQ